MLVQQVDNLSLVKDKWAAISKSIGIVDDGAVDKAKKADKRAQEVVLRRFQDAQAQYPLLFQAEDQFWASQSDNDRTSAPFPDGFNSKGFVTQAEPRTLASLSVAATWLMGSLDNVSRGFDGAPEGLPQIVKEELSSLWALEETANLPVGCKKSRPDIELHLQSSADRNRAPSRLAYNPLKDLNVGHVAVVMADPDDTPGQRGWDLVVVISAIDLELDLNGAQSLPAFRVSNANGVMLACRDRHPPKVLKLIPSNTSIPFRSSTCSRLAIQETFRSLAHTLLGLLTGSTRRCASSRMAGVFGLGRFPWTPSSTASHH